jgi:sialic acid synthase SpsE
MHGPDHKASLEPDKFKEMVRAIRNIEKAFGTHNKKVLPREKNIRKLARRSIIAIQDIPRNKKIKIEDVDVLRPTGGIAPKYLYKVLGRNTSTYIKKGTKLKWSLLD